MLSLDYDTYSKQYEEILNNLDAKVVREELFDLAGGKVPALLCYEAPPFTTENFCHRHHVSRWMYMEGGVMMVEWEPPHPQEPYQLF